MLPEIKDYKRHIKELLSINNYIYTKVVSSRRADLVIIAFDLNRLG